MKKLEDWWRGLSPENRHDLKLISPAIVIIICIVIVSIFTGCPSKTLSSLEQKVEQKIENLDEKAAERVEKI